MRLSGPIFCSFLISTLAAGSICQGKASADSSEGLQERSAITSFRIASADAFLALEVFAEQAEIPIVYLVKQVQGVNTNAVNGEYSPREALDRLVADTILEVVEDKTIGVLLVKRADSLDQSTRANEQARSPNSQANPEIGNTASMNQKKRTIGGLFKGLLTLALASSPELIAQSPSDGGEQEVYELSPFTVDASGDTGYRATSTLAGTRIKTNLKDLGSAISVITSEFMEDTGAVDAGSLLSYTSNTEVGGSQGNYSGAEDSGDGRYYQTEERTNPQQNQRIRGLGRADLTRGFFLTDIGFDTYNTDRVTVSRGPNSLLFGIGSPGGVINNNTKQAFQNKNFGEVKIRLDNYGSMRSELDLNRSLVEGRIALRLAALNDDLEYKQKPAWNRDERIYGALDVVLFKNEKSDSLDATKLRINGESGTSKGSPVEVLPPSVAYHGWFEAIPASIQQFSGIAPAANAVDPSEGGNWEYQATYNPFEENSENGINTNTHPSIFRHIGIVYDDPNATSPNLGTGDGLQGYQGLLTWNTSLDTLDSTGLAGTPGVGGATGDASVARTVEYHANSPYSEPYAIGFAVPTLQNTDVFDYRNKMYSGGIDLVQRDFSAYNFALEQSFFNNRLAFEVAYDQQRYETMQDFFFTGGNGTSTTGPYDIYVSIAEFLQNGQPNPNLGRAYTRVARPEVRFSETDRETVRFTAFGDLDLREKENWMQHLGRHRFTALYNDHTRDSHSMNWRESWVSSDFDIRSALQAPNLDSARAPVNALVFTSDSLLGLSSLDDVRLSQINVPRPQPGDTFNVVYADTSSAGADRTLETGGATIERYLNDENISQTKIEAKAVAWQSYFLDEHIVGLLGYREDDTMSFSRANEAEVGFDDRLELGRYNPDFARLSSAPSLEESGNTVTWSVVGRYPEKLLGELPGGMDIQFHYAESENFNPIGLRNNALGQSIGQPTGTTKEYGLLTSFADEKLTLKLNWFETSLNDVSAAPNVNVAGEAISLINNYRDADLSGRTFDNQLVTVVGEPGSFPIQDYATFYNLMEGAIPSALRDVINPRQEDTDNDGVWDQLEWDSIPSMRSTQDRVAEGFEVELVASPTKAWRILANISQQEATQSNTASVMASIVEEFNSNLQSTRLGELRRDASGDVQTRPINEIWLVDGVAPIRAAKALDDTVSNEQREWRFTGVSTYRFMEGPLKGASVGGSVRWEDEAATGYVFVLEPDTGVPVPDVSRPFYDDSLLSGDLWLSYEKRLFDQVDWKIQLNVRNAFGDDDDLPVKTNPDGQIAVIRMPNPRTIYLSNSFKF